MKLFIVAVPLFDDNMEVEAYSLKYLRGDLPLGTARTTSGLDGATSSPGLDILNTVGLKPFTNGKKIFVPINQYLLLANFADRCSIAPELMVCVLSKDFPLEPQYLRKCMELKHRGFSFALDDIEYSLKTTVLFDLADYIIYYTDTKDFGEKMLESRTQKPTVVTILANIENQELFNKIKGVPNALFAGKFYSRPLSKGVKKISPLKNNALHLLKVMGANNAPDVEVQEIAGHIQKDAALSIALLRFINSPVIGLRQQINSINHAISMLGLNQTRKWVMAAVATYLAFDEPNELTRLILLRAKFAENLAGAFQLTPQSSDLFLMGLLSLLDVVLEMPMAEALQQVSPKQMIYEALANQEGNFYKVLELIYSYEFADWEKVSRIMIVHSLSVEVIQQAFMDALLWYRDLLLENA